MIHIIWSEKSEKKFSKKCRKFHLGKSPNTCPVTIQKTLQAIVIGIGEKDAVAGSVSTAVGKIADYIESVGY